MVGVALGVERTGEKTFRVFGAPWECTPSKYDFEFVAGVEKNRKRFVQHVVSRTASALQKSETIYIELWNEGRWLRGRKTPRRDDEK